MPLLNRAKVRYRDMYSLRWTFVSLARASGEAAFNVSRVIGHSRSTIVDTIYAHTVDSALAGKRERFGARRSDGGPKC
jgi:integrase